MIFHVIPANISGREAVSAFLWAG